MRPEGLLLLLLRILYIRQGGAHAGLREWQVNVLKQPGSSLEGQSVNWDSTHDENRP